jgi:hypothetical protein
MGRAGSQRWSRQDAMGINEREPGTACVSSSQFLFMSVSVNAGATTLTVISLDPH